MENSADVYEELSEIEFTLKVESMINMKNNLKNANVDDNPVYSLYQRFIKNVQIVSLEERIILVQTLLNEKGGLYKLRKKNGKINVINIESH